jgi:2-dehydro-3-deoxygalactonokinase
MDGLADVKEDTLCVFPGTHSKHILVKDKVITDFKTFMTGEIFSVMSNHSILKDTIEKPGQSTIDEDAYFGLKQGVKHSQNTDLLGSLFSVRVNQLFKKLSKRQNYYYLSGLLIGSELRGVNSNKNTKIILCSGSNVFEMYKLALTELGLLPKTTLISPEIMDKAAIAGQVKMYLNRLKN